MNINDLLNGQKLPSMPMRAWLSQDEGLEPDVTGPIWILEDCWGASESQPLLTGAKIREFHLGDIACLAVIGHAVTLYSSSGNEDEVSDDDERTFIYLLNPADPCVWDAIASWEAAPFRQMRIRSGRGSLATTLQADLELLDARSAKDNELDSDLLAGELLKLMKESRLEEVLRNQLGIKRPMYLAIVETPMLCKSLTPLSAEELEQARAYRAHKSWVARFEE